MSMNEIVHRRAPPRAGQLAAHDAQKTQFSSLTSRSSAQAFYPRRGRLHRRTSRAIRAHARMRECAPGVSAAAL